MGGDKGEGSIQNVENYGIINMYEVLIAGAQIHIILFFKILSKFVQIVHTNFHAKSGVCSSKNERVMALGIKEDGIYLSVQTSFLLFSKFGQKSKDQII